jgi:hypothetical protein
MTIVLNDTSFRLARKILAAEYLGCDRLETGFGFAQPTQRLFLAPCTPQTSGTCKRMDFTNAQTAFHQVLPDAVSHGEFYLPGDSFNSLLALANQYPF